MRTTISRIALAACFLHGGHLLWGTELVVLGVGNDASQVTRLSVTNRSTASADVKLEFIGAPDGPAPDFVVATIPPLGTLTWENALQDIWQLSDSHGTVRVSSDEVVVATASRFVQKDDGGRSGSALPVYSTLDLPGTGDVGDLPWLDTTSSLEVFIPDTATQVECRILDSNGQQVGMQTISGGPASYRLPVSLMLISDPGTGPIRAEVKINSGSAVAAAESTMESSGQKSVSGIIVKGMAGPALMVSSAFHGTLWNGARLTTGLRLFNPGTSSAPVRVQFRDNEYKFDLAARTLVQVDDVLGPWFSAEDGASGRLDVTTTSNILGVARTTSSKDGDPSIVYQALEPLKQTLPLILTGSTGVIGGLRGSNANQLMNLWATATDAARADLTLLGTDGQMLAGVTLDFDAGEVKSAALSDLLGGVAVPEDAVLQVTALQGDLSISALTVDNSTGGVSTLTAQTDTTSTLCAVPEISLFNASARNLTAAGDVTLYWTVRMASSISLQNLADDLPASSSQSVHVDSTTSFKLVASNSCGEVSEGIGVSVGPPVLAQAFVPGGAAPDSGAQPGQLLLVQLANVGDPSRLSSVILRDSGQIEIELPVAGFAADGTPYVRVPLLADPLAPGGYLSGSFSIAAVVDDVESAPIPLTILPLALPGDPVGAFRALLDGIDAAGQSAVADFNDLGASDGVQEALKSAASIGAELRQLLDSIASTGSGALNPGYPSGAGYSAAPMTVTANDLALVLALNANYIASSGTGDTAQQPSAALKAADSGGGGTCIQNKEPYIPLCQKLEGTLDSLWLLLDPHPQVFNNQELDDAFNKGRDEAVKYITKKLEQSAVSGVLGKVNLMVNWTSLLCTLQPIRLDNFRVTPTQFPVADPRFVKGVEVRALLAPKYKQSEIAAKLVEQETGRLMSQIPKKYSDLKPLVQPAIQSFVQSLFGDLDSDIAAYVQRNVPGLRPSQDLQVGRCDIDRFYAARNSPDQWDYDDRKAIIIPMYTQRPEWGRDTYFFAGRRKGPETMCVMPIEQNFLFSANYYKRSLGKNPCGSQAVPGGGVRGSSKGRSVAQGIPRAPRKPQDLVPTRVLVDFAEVSADGVPKLWVSNSTVNAWCYCDDQDPSGIILPGTRTSDTVFIEDTNTFNAKLKWRQSAAEIEVKKLGESRWSALLTVNSVREVIKDRVQYHDALATVQVNFSNVPNRDNTHTIAVTVTTNSVCFQPASFTGYVSGVTGGSTSIVQQPTLPFVMFKRFYTGREQGFLRFTVGGELSGFPNDTSNCKLDALIEMLDGPPPP